MKTGNRNFYFNYGNYLTKLKPEFEKYFKPEMIFQFGLPLPFYIPFPEKIHLTYKINPGEVCNFFFSSYTTVEKVHTGFYEGEAIIVDVIKTRVEINYAFSEDDHKNYEENEHIKLTEVFEAALSKLNTVIEAYIAKTSDDRVYRLTKEHFDITLIYRVLNPKFNFEISEGLFNLHSNAPNLKADPLDFSKTDEIMKYIDVVEEKTNPFLNSNEFIVNAKRDFKFGNYRQAVVNVQTGIEVYLYTMYREFLKQEGYSIEDIVSKSEKMRFKSLVTDQIHKRLGGDFDICNSSEIVGQWWQKTYLLRNRIVHEGYYPFFDECDYALYHAMELMNYLVKLIHTEESKDNYPELANFIKCS